MLVKERWVPIEGYDGKYLVSNYGHVERTYRNVKSRRLNPYQKKGKTRAKSYVVKLTDLAGKSKEVQVHSLVLNAFVGSAKEDEVPYHKDGNPANCYAGNLRWVSKKKHGQLTGEKSNKNKRVCKIDRYGYVIKKFDSARKAAKAAKVSYQSIMDRCNGLHKYAFALDGYEYAWDDSIISMRAALQRIQNRRLLTEIRLQKELNMERRIYKMDCTVNPKEFGKEIKEVTVGENTITYKIVNGTAYHEKTPMNIVNVLERARKQHIRVRIYYGDKKTGQSWMDENDTIGYIERSCGEIKVPLIICNKRTMGGPAVLDDCIIKITTTNKRGYKVLFENPKFYVPELVIQDASDKLKEDGYSHSVFVNDINTANFRSKEKAEYFVAFIKGETHLKRYY